MEVGFLCPDESACAQILCSKGSLTASRTTTLSPLRYTVQINALLIADNNKPEPAHVAAQQNKIASSHDGQAARCHRETVQQRRPHQGSRGDREECGECRSRYAVVQVSPGCLFIILSERHAHTHASQEVQYCTRFLHAFLYKVLHVNTVSISGCLDAASSDRAWRG